MNCIACVLESKKIRASNAPSHTCAKSRKDYQEHTSKILSDNTKVFCIKIYDELRFTDNAILYRLEVQFLNGYKVKRFAELWVYNEHSKLIETFGVNKYVWVTKKFYDKLVFL